MSHEWRDARGIDAAVLMAVDVMLGTLFVPMISYTGG